MFLEMRVSEECSSLVWRDGIHMVPQRRAVLRRPIAKKGAAKRGGIPAKI